MLAKWVRKAPGHHERIGSDGKTELCTVVKAPTRRANGMNGPDGWDAYIYPKGVRGWVIVRRGYKTLKEAKFHAEIAYRQAVKDIVAGLPSEQ